MKAQSIIKRSIQALPRLGIFLLLAAALVGIPAHTVAAQTSQPITIIPLMVIPGGYVMVQINHLPADDTFTVTMGPAGSRGINGYVVSHISTDGAVSTVYQFEIHSLVRDQKSIDLRIQSSTGYAAYVNFDNTRRATAQPTGSPTASTAGSTPSQSASGSSAPPKKGPSIIQVIHVDEDLTVQAVIYNLPPDTEFTVSIGPLYTRGKEKYVVAHLTTPHSFDGTNVSTFEIPKNLRDQNRLILYVEAPGYQYVTGFNNVDF